MALAFVGHLSLETCEHRFTLLDVDTGMPPVVETVMKRAWISSAHHPAAALAAFLQNILSIAP